MIVFDLESDGLLLDEVTKIHVLSYTRNGKDIVSLFDYDEMRELLLAEDILVGHNIILYDIPVIEKILGIKVKAKLWDTLPLSWYINHDRFLHGLEEYGEYYGVPKPKIDNWQTLSRSEYAHRCQEDVKINWLLWRDLRSYLLRLYDSRQEVERIINYLSFKMDCAVEQSKSRWKVDVERVVRNIAELEEEQKQKFDQLVDVMPQQEIWASKTRPAKPYKKDGTYSVHGAKWFALLKEHNLPENYLGEVQVKIGEKEANPNSSDQVKAWLASLGWEPTSFNYVKEDNGSERAIPQVRVDGDDGKELCPSVLALAEEHPEIKYLEGLTVVQHRLGIFKNFLKFEQDGWLKAEIHGLTNTLRFKHKNPLVNLPGVDKPYGKEIRGSLIAPEGYVLCGSDMVSLESNTKRHYMYPYDPKYVEEMSHPDFDEHLDLAVQAKEIKQEDALQYVKKNSDFSWVKPIRTKFKPVNYGCVYGVKKNTLSRQTGMTPKQAQELIDIYWERNWAVLEVVDNTKTKTVDGKMWLYNPVSGFYYSLRYEKDKFSTLNQGTGVYCFDTWIRHFRKVGSQLTAQFHDEIVSCIPVGREEQYEKILRTAIDKTNNQLKLNITLDIDVQFGATYADIH